MYSAYRSILLYPNKDKEINLTKNLVL